MLDLPFRGRRSSANDWLPVAGRDGTGYSDYDPVLEAAPEPRLNRIGNPDWVVVDCGVGRPVPVNSLVRCDSSFSNRLHMAPTNEHAQMANAVKLQVTVEVNEGALPEAR